MQTIKQNFSQFFLSQEEEETFKNIEKKKNYSEIISINYPVETLSELENYKGSIEMREYAYLCHTKIPILRKIRGDGNCFYRGFSFQLMEKILMDKNEGYFFNIYNYIYSLDKNYFNTFCEKKTTDSLKIDLKNIRNILLSYYKGLYEFSRKLMKRKENNWREKISKKLANFFNKNQLFDVGNIILFRIIVWEIKEVFLNTNIDQILKENLKACENQLDKIKHYGKKTKEINCCLFSKLFDIKIEVFYGEANNHKSSEYFNLFKNKEKLFPIYFYFKSGHYDVAYDNEFSEMVFLDILDNNKKYHLESYLPNKDLNLLKKNFEKKTIKNKSINYDNNVQEILIDKIFYEKYK